MKDSNFNKIKYLINSIIALIIYILISKKNRNMKYWLIGGHLGNLYTDNSKAFFEFLINANKENTFWVLNKNSLAEKDNEHKDNILYRGSIKAYLYCYRSECIIVSHCFADVIPIIYKIKSLFSFKSIFLEHGVYGLKKIIGEKENYYCNFDIVACVGQYEKQIKHKYLNIPNSNLKIVGLPRYDKLLKNIKSNGNIMVMFTWREYESNDISAINKFLTNKHLIEILKQYNSKLNVIIHSFIGDNYEKIKKLENSYVKVADKNVDIQEYLKNNSLLITDYSSVAWDFSYMNKPVIFYQFDLEDYLKFRGSYIDLKKDLFGEVVYEEDKLIDLIELYFKNNFKINNREFKRVHNYFKYIDNQNCERLYEEIKKIINI